MNQENFTKPYLVIPKLIQQPTWGGTYIATNKGWIDRPGCDIKIGQSYELFSGSNLSLLSSSVDPLFMGEITDNDSVQNQTYLENTLPISELVATNPDEVLGKSVVAERGAEMCLLIKYTQALGNSFQVHIRDGEVHETRKAKPECWYYFEPGLLTLGIKSPTDWSNYEVCLRAVDRRIDEISKDVKHGVIDLDDGRKLIADTLKEYDPWQYVNVVHTDKDQIVDLSSGGIHHSWEEDANALPDGNILLELQHEAMDDVSTFRGFDKGKMSNDGTVRELQLDTYFEVIDRTEEANDPQNHIAEGTKLETTDSYTVTSLMRSRYFNMNRVDLQTSTYTENIDSFRHLFIKSGTVTVSTASGKVTVTSGHSCFIPAASEQFTVENIAGHSEILVSF